MPIAVKPFPPNPSARVSLSILRRRRASNHRETEQLTQQSFPPNTSPSSSSRIEINRARFRAGSARFCCPNQVLENQREEIRAIYLGQHPNAFWVDFGDFQFLRIEPKVVQYVSGVATALLGSGEFSREEFSTAVMDPIYQFSKPTTVSLENGMVIGFDVRAAISELSSEPKPTFTLNAHEKSSFCNLL